MMTTATYTSIAENMGASVCAVVMLKDVYSQRS